MGDVILVDSPLAFHCDAERDLFPSRVFPIE